VEDINPVKGREENEREKFCRDVEAHGIKSDLAKLSDFRLIKVTCDVEDGKSFQLYHVSQSVEVGAKPVEVIKRKPVKEVEHDLVKTYHRDEKSYGYPKILLVALFNHVSVRVEEKEKRQECRILEDRYRFDEPKNICREAISKSGNYAREADSDEKKKGPEIIFFHHIPGNIICAATDKKIKIFNLSL